MENTISDCYKSISALAKGVYKDNGSKFLSFAFPVEKEEQVKKIISDIKKEYFDARHHCYAYRLGYKGDIWRMYDDGEPSSTAGKPIYGQILSNELSDILIVVVRYFGGVKLGVPGLIKAYKTAAYDAISNALIVEKTAAAPFKISFDYEKMNGIMKILKDFGIIPVYRTFEQLCEMEVNVRLRDKGAFVEAMEKIAQVEEVKINNQ